MPTLSRQADGTPGTVMPFDRACWHTVDPASLLFTGVTKDNLDDKARLPDITSA